MGRRAVALVAALLALALLLGWWTLGGPDRRPEPVASITEAIRNAGGGHTGPQEGRPPPGDRDLPVSGDLGADSAGLMVVKVTSENQPVVGATVHLYRRGEPVDEWRAAGAGTSDAQGSTSLPAPAGSYLVSVTARGLARGLMQALRPTGERLTAVEVRLAPAAELAGQVVEKRGGAPVPLAKVSAAPSARLTGGRRLELPPEERTTVTADAHGQFKLGGLQPGRVDVEAKADGFATAARRDVQVPTAAIRVELHAAATVEGHVTRAGRSAEGALVTLLGPSGSVSVTAGPGGAYAAEVEPGLQRVLAALDGETGAAARPVPAPAGSTVRHVDVALGAPATVAGRVTSAAGPVEGAVIVATRRDDRQEVASATSDSDGRYVLTPLAPAVYAVTTGHAGQASASTTGITLRPGDRFRLDVSLRVPSTIEGTVSDLDGSPVGGALVTASTAFGRAGPSGGGPPAWAGGGRAARADASGRYRLIDVVPGQVRILARRDLASVPATSEVSLAEEEAAHQDLTLVEGGVISGAVRDTSGQPVLGALVVALPAGRPSRPGELLQASADAGGYTLALPVGSYRLLASRTGSDLLFRGRPQPLATVTMAPGQELRADLVLPDEPQPSVSGVVLEPGGAPSSGATVWTGVAGPGARFTRTSADGAFELALAPGEVVQLSARNGGRAGTASTPVPSPQVALPLQPAARVVGTLIGDPPPDTFAAGAASTAFTPGGGTGDSQFTGNSFELDDVLPGQISIHVKTGDGRIGTASTAAQAGETATVQVQLSPAAAVAGRLLDGATGQPVVRARLLVDGLPSRRSLGGDGRFSIGTIAGSHQITFSAPGYAPSIRTVQAQVGATADVGDVLLAPAAGAAPAR